MRKLAFLMLATTTLAAGGLNVRAQGQLQSVVELPTSSESQAVGGEHINFLHQREWVRLGSDGVIAGKLLVLNSSGQTEGRIGARVVVSRDGQAILETESDVDGSFKLDGLEPGAYAIQCRGDYTFAAYALHVLPSEAAHLSSDLEIYASVIPEARAAELIAGNLVPGDLEVGSDAYYRDFKSDPIAADRQFNNSHRIALRDGALVGRVSRPGWTYAEQDLTGTVAQIVQNGEVIGQSAVAKDGYYEISNVVPGVYDLFVTGDDGFAVLSFEAVAASEPVATKVGAIHMVSAQIGMASDCLCCELIEQPEISACSTCAPPAPIIEEVVMIEPCGLPVDSCGCGVAPSCGCGYGGGFGGGGGGFGGGGFGGGGAGGGGIGGLGGLLGVAGLALGVTALADNDSGYRLGTPVVE